MNQNTYMTEGVEQRKNVQEGIHFYLHSHHLHHHHCITINTKTFLLLVLTLITIDSLSPSSNHSLLASSHPHVVIYSSPF
jgi:hypothetical protein